VRTATKLGAVLGFLVVLFVACANPAHAEVNAPGGLDLGGLTSGIGDAFASALSQFWRQTVEQFLPFTLLRGFLGIVGAVADWLAFNFRGVLQGYDIITRTPERWTVENPLVNDLWGKSRLIATAATVLFIIRNGFIIMSKDIGSVGRGDAKARMGKLVFSLIYANFSMWVWGIAVTLNNMICAYFLERGTLPGAEGLSAFDTNTVNGLAVIFYVVWAVRLFISMVARLAIVDVGIIVSPFAIMLNTIPEGRPYHELWQKFSFGTLFSQVIVVILLAIGTSFISSSLLPEDSMGPGIANLLIGLGVMEVALRAPSAIGKMLFGAGSYSGGGGIAHTIMITGAVAAGGMGVARTAATRMAGGK
jgi:hypothetical protein